MDWDKILSTFCHHKVKRLLDLDDGASLLCARCSGIYMGFIIGFLGIQVFRSIVSPSKNKAHLIIPFLLVCILPAEVLFEKLSVTDPGNYIRFLSGTSFGVGFSSIVGMFFAIDKTPTQRTWHYGGLRNHITVFSALVLSSVLPLLLPSPLVVNALTLSGLTIAYLSVNYLICKVLLELKSRLFCIILSAFFTIVQWGFLFLCNNYLHPISLFSR